MLQMTYRKQLLGQVKAFDAGRRDIQALASQALHASKRAIFAFHREDLKEADMLVAQAKTALQAGWKIIKKQLNLAHEGAWRAAQEEYVEASLLKQYLETGKLDKVKDVADEPEIFLGGFSDLTGELTRRAVMLAGEGRFGEVETIFQNVRTCVDFLLEMDLTGHLRTKVDQAKSNLRKLEEIRYDISMRKRV